MAYKHQNSAFDLIKEPIEKFLLDKQDDFVSTIQKSGGRTPREWVYSLAANLASDMLQTGNLHIFPGMLNPLGPGPGLLAIHMDACDTLVQMGAITAERAERQKTNLQANVKNAG